MELTITVALFSAVTVLCTAIFITRMDPTNWGPSWEDEQDENSIRVDNAIDISNFTGNIPGWELLTTLQKQTLLSYNLPEKATEKELRTTLVMNNPKNFYKYRQMHAVLSGFEEEDRLDGKPKYKPNPDKFCLMNINITKVKEKIKPKKKVIPIPSNLPTNPVEILRLMPNLSKKPIEKVVQVCSAAFCTEWCSGPFMKSNRWSCECGELEKAFKRSNISL